MPGWSAPALPGQWSGRAARPPLVGRSRELRHLEAVWSDVRAGVPRTVLVGGEAGAGKSRLAAEVAVAVHAAGASVLLGGCTAEDGRPFDPFVRPVGVLLDAVEAGDLVLREGRPTDSPLQDLLRGITGQAGTATDAGDREATVRAMLDGVDALLAAACGARPLLLVLEDLHWAGRSGLNLLRHVVEHTESVPLLVLGTYRSTPPDRSDILGATVSDLLRREDVHRLDVGALRTADVAELLVASGAGPADEVQGAAQTLRQHTGGNALLVNEVWRDLAAAGGVEAMRTGGLAVPESLRVVMTARLARLTEEQRRLVRVGAVVGEVFDADLVAAAAPHDVSVAQVFEAMEAARGAGVLEAVAERPGRYRFAHALAQHAVRSELGSLALAQTHAAVAATLVAREGTGTDGLYRLAYHYALAAGLGLDAEAARYLRIAGETAERQLALSDAGAFYERATEHLPPGPDRDRVTLAAARCHLLAGRRLRAMELCDRAASSEDPEIRLLAAIGYVDASWRSGSGTGAHHGVELLRRAVDSSGRPPEDPLVVHASATLASALMLTGAEDEALRCADDAIRRARAIADPDLLATVLDESMFVGVGLESLRGRAVHAAELTELCRTGGQWTYAGRAAMVRCHAAYVFGDRTALSTALEDLTVAARETRQPYISWTLHLFMTSLQLLRCDVAAARATMAAARRIEAQFEPGASAGEGPASLQEFMIRRESGRLAFARSALESGLALESHWRPGVVALCVETGMVDRAREPLREALRWDLPVLRTSATWPASLSFLGEAAVELGDAESMRTLLPEAERFSGVNLMGGEMLALCGSGDLLVGLLRGGLGLDGVEECFAASLAMDRGIGSVLHEATTHAHWAAHLRRSRARADQVQEHEGPAREAAARHGLARVSRILGPERPAQRPDGLTAREVEVLGLLAEGASNRVIAARLVISEHTAANHVRSILLKTGSPNRTAAARYAMRHRLVGRRSDDGES